MFPFKVKAIASYTPSSSSELALVAGEVYDVLSDDGKGVWYQACVQGVNGWFPANYTEPYQESSAPSIPEPISSTPLSPTSTSQVDSSKQQGNALKLSKSSKDKNKGKKKKSSNGTGKKKSSKPPIPLKTFVEKNKKNLPCTLHIQVIEAKGLKAAKGDINKSKTSAHVFIKDLIKDDERKIGSTDTKKKTLSPRWNYLYKAVLKDAETEAAIVKLCQGESYDKKNVIAEHVFLLRSSERDFDAPNYQFKWYPLVNNDGPAGEIRVYIEYFDTRQTSAPSNFQHIGHIGWSKENGFDVENIPQEWKELFKEVGITKGQLRDKNFAETVYNIIQETSDLSAPPPIPSTPSSPSGQTMDGMAPPPPPPPMVQGGSKSTPPPVPPPLTSSQGSSGEAEDSNNDLLAAIRKGKTLNKVELDTSSSSVSTTENGGLADMLKKAMESHRNAMTADRDEDWSDDDDWSDD